MVVQIQLGTGADIETKVYRDVAAHNYSNYVAGFYANQPFYIWGKLIKIKGKERSVMHTFGKVPENE